MPPERRERIYPFGSERASACTLSAVAGFVDSAGFIALFGMLPSHVTGDIVSVGIIAAGSGSTSILLKFAMLPLFMLGVATSALFARHAREAEVDPLTPLLSLLALGLAIFCAVGSTLGRGASSDDTLLLLSIGGTAVFAMGIQNAMMREALTGLVPTTVMTGNLTQLTINLVEVVASLRDPDPAARARAVQAAKARLLNSGAPLLGFAAGVLLGGLSTSRVGLLSIALPTLVVAGMSLSAYNRIQLAARGIRKPRFVPLRWLRRTVPFRVDTRPGL